MMVIILCYLQLIVTLLHNKEYLSLNNAICIILFLSLGVFAGCHCQKCAHYRYIFN